MCSLDVDELAIALSSGIIEEPLSLLKPGNVSRMYDTHITLRKFVRGCMPIISTINECIRDSIRGKICYGYYIYKILKLSLKTSKENTCAGTCLMIVPLAVSIGFLISRRSLVSLRDVLYNATILLKRYSTCNDTIMFYKALKMLNISYIRSRNVVPALPDVNDEDSSEIILKQNLTLWKLLRYCASIDICSRQVVTYYSDILELLKLFKNFLERYGNIDYSILLTYYKALSLIGDTMILRKYGIEKFFYLKNIGETMFKICIENEESCINESKKLHEMFVKNGINPGSIADLIAIMLSLYRLEEVLSEKC
ncbi:MAG: hypothetical protein GXO26_00980 [Crenarchaeota archaeon]|nr:hypothetical protein [Thermoproteota archaeon]